MAKGRTNSRKRVRLTVAKGYANSDKGSRSGDLLCLLGAHPAKKIDQVDFKIKDMV